VTLIPKTEFKRMPRYLEYIRTLPCVICKTTYDIQAAHVRYIAPSGTGIKPSDQHVLSLCQPCHADQHSRGEELWWKSKKLDPKEITEGLWDIFNLFENKAQAWSNAVLYVEGINEFRS
jgi:hypothetical protein